jgi:hypothetical protein
MEATLSAFVRMLPVAAMAAGLLFGSSAGRADDAVASGWQEVISGQIQAFREHDAATAFSYAGAPFQTSFPSAEVFFEAIVGSGYAPIMDSRSHTFGAYQMMGEGSVMQEVTLFGNDQSLYEAFYALDDEPDGWRVEGVILKKREGVGI